MKSVTTTHTMALTYGTTARDLKDFLADVPLDAKVSVHVIKGDRPGDSDSASITATHIVKN